MHFEIDCQNPARKKQPAFIDEALLLLRSCLNGRPELRDVLDALWNIDGIYGISVKGASYAFRRAWFISDSEFRHEELAHALSRIVAHICCNDSFVLAPDQPVTSAGLIDEEVDLDELLWLYRYDPIRNTTDLDAFFSQPLPRSAPSLAKAREGAGAIYAGGNRR